MKNIKIKLLLIVLIILLFPININADVTCSEISDAVESYNNYVSKLEELDCDNIEDESEVAKCNDYNVKKALVLSQIFSYNDEKTKCNKKQIEEIVEKNKDQCTNVFGTKLKDIAHYGLNFFYVVAPFLLMIFGILDFTKIVVGGESLPKQIKTSRQNFIRRLISFILIYFIPVILNLIFSLSDKMLTYDSNVYSCTSNISYHMPKWETIYVPQGNSKSSSGGSSSVTGNGLWHTDWFQCDSRWGSHAWAGDSGSVCKAGCGSLATSIVCAHYKGDDSESSYCYPYNTAEEFYSKGQQPNQSTDGINLFFNDWHSELGVTSSLTYSNYAPLDFNKLDSVLANGGAYIAVYSDAVKYNGISVWTSGAHYITVFAGNQTDGYRVADSNDNHETGGSGVAEWAPYGSHVFSKEYLDYPKYYYFIEKK